MTQNFTLQESDKAYTCQGHGCEHQRTGLAACTTSCAVRRKAIEQEAQERQGRMRMDAERKKV